jgi:hypothetical protein
VKEILLQPKEFLIFVDTLTKQQKKSLLIKCKQEWKLLYDTTNVLDGDWGNGIYIKYQESL